MTAVNLLSGNPERYSGWLLCTENGNPDWDSERSYIFIMSLYTKYT